MAEHYPPGLQRLWYRATGFNEGMVVKGDFKGPGGIQHTGLTFTEDSGGLYFLDYDFPVVGSYVVVISENGVKKTSQNFLIEKPPSRSRGKGNLLNS